MTTDKGVPQRFDEGTSSTGPSTIGSCTGASVVSWWYLGGGSVCLGGISAMLCSRHSGVLLCVSVYAPFS